DGLLNANGNNVFLINPNGVIITKNGTINANRFVASTSSMSNEDMQRFANMDKTQGANFSPVFKPNKLGNVVNMGNINANKVLLIGNKVLLQSSFNTKNKTFNQIKASNIHLVGNEIHADIATLKDINKLYITAKDKGSLYLNATGYYYNPSSFSNFNYEAKNYNGINHNNTNFSNAKYVGIGSDIDWWHFAKGWNEDKAGFRDTASEYRLTNDIDFKGNKGKGKEGKDWQNYANYCIDGLGCTSMIVGFDYSNAFSKTFDGQGYTLKNINIDTSKISGELGLIGLFGGVKDATIKNINVDYMGGGIKASVTDTKFYSNDIGGFAGGVSNGTFSNISLNNVGGISVSANINNTGRWVHTGGFIGNGSGTFTNISLNNIDSISSILNIGNDSRYAYNYIGGFAGGAYGTLSNISLDRLRNISGGGYEANVGGFVGNTDATFSNISLNNIGNISGKGFAGGFAGNTNGGTYTNISLNNIGNISSQSNPEYIAGFVGYAGNDGTFSNISLNNISIKGGGGFAGNATSGTFSNISLNNISVSSVSYAGGFASAIDSGTFSNISLNNISVSSDNYVGGFVGFIRGGGGTSTFKNIYIFFNPSMSISASGGDIGKFFGGKYNSSVLTFDNVHIYHHKDDLANANNDSDYWGNSNDKIQIHAYNDNDKNQAYNQFKQQDNTIARPIVQLPNITPPSNPSNPPDLTDTNVKLDENDLHQD
ncbi:filamentous hemagglutinin N-terminal domain-containing protein, partial [Campylobacter armoricus]|uniref:two-partner secretion domain-containing protein n=1 Tax=Campylobacter armoricus TaxID=2505970 RepID=UPI0011178400